MEALSIGLVAIANGVLRMIETFTSVKGLALVAIALSFLWLVACEVESLDRSAYKPDVELH